MGGGGGSCDGRGEIHSPSFSLVTSPTLPSFRLATGIEKTVQEIECPGMRVEYYRYDWEGRWIFMEADASNVIFPRDHQEGLEERQPLYLISFPDLLWTKPKARSGKVRKFLFLDWLLHLAPVQSPL